MAQFTSPPKAQFFDSNGDPLSGGKVYTYEPGTTTNKNSYPTIADAKAGTNANANPVILDSRGEAAIVLAGNTKIKVDDSSDNNIYTVDNVNDDETILDNNGNEILDFTTTASAVNHFLITNAATGNDPVLSAVGGDTNLGLKLKTKGTGDVTFLDGSDNEIAVLNGVSSAVNYLQLSASSTGNAPDIAALGDDLNIDLSLSTKGTGDIVAYDGSGNEIAKLNGVTSAVNYPQLTASATGANVSVEAQGDDLDIGLTFKCKGGDGIVMANDVGTIVGFNAVATMVNYFDFTASATGNAVLMKALGTDLNIGMTVSTKGTGVFTVTDGTNEIFSGTPVASAVNYMDFKASATGSGPIITATGSDLGIDINIAPKGTGALWVNGNSTAAGAIILGENTVNGSNFVGFQAPASVVSNVTWELPSSDGTNGQVLTTNGSGVLSWGTTQAGIDVWANIDVTTISTIQDHVGVSSIVDNGAGDITVNFTTAFLNATYAAAGMSANVAGTEYYVVVTSVLAGSHRFLTVSDAGVVGDGGTTTVMYIGDN